MPPILYKIAQEYGRKHWGKKGFWLVTSLTSLGGLLLMFRGIRILWGWSLEVTGAVAAAISLALFVFCVFLGLSEQAQKEPSGQHGGHQRK
jgi:hypothetical protein